jgi:hypothetical protein
VTEAGVPSCSYLFFDGGSDFMATGNIDFTATDKMTVWAGVRKNSDAVVQHVAELSINSGNNAGSFALLASDYAAGAAAYALNLFGSQRAHRTASPFAAPISNVITGTLDIAEATREAEIGIRIDGVVPTITGGGNLNAGTGNFGTYPLYIGSRAGTSVFFNGNLFGLVVRGAASTTAQITATEAWLAPKTGVVLP